MLLLSFKTCLQIVSKFLVQVMWKDSYHFSPVQGSLSIQWADSGNFWGKKKHKSPGSVRGQEQFAQTGVSIKGFLQLCCPLKCILSCKRRTISLAVLMVQSKQTTKKWWWSETASVGQKLIALERSRCQPWLGRARGRGSAQAGQHRALGLVSTKHAETFWPKILYVSLVEILSACPIYLITIFHKWVIFPPSLWSLAL